jgi:hypothetical protein
MPSERLEWVQMLVREASVIVFTVFVVYLAWLLVKHLMVCNGVLHA